MKILIWILISVSIAGACLADGKDGFLNGNLFTIAYSNVTTASIKKIGTVTYVILPLNLKRSIEQKFPNFRLPISSDYKDVKFSGQEKGEVAVIDEIPFVAFGDFHHTGKQDIAISLVNKEDPKTWQTIIFQEISNEYIPSFLSDVGNSYMLGIAEDGVPSDGNNHDCLELIEWESASVDYCWDGEKFIVQPDGSGE